MRPIRRKLKRATKSAQAEPLQAQPIGVEPLDTEYAGAEPRLTGDEAAVLIVFVIVLLASGVALFSWLDLPGEAAAVGLIIVALFLGLYRLRRPNTEKWPNPTFDRRDEWPVRQRPRPINLAPARPAIESTLFLPAARRIRKALQAHSKSEWLMALGIALGLFLFAMLSLWQPSVWR